MQLWEEQPERRIYSGAPRDEKPWPEGPRLGGAAQGCLNYCLIAVFFDVFFVRLDDDARIAVGVWNKSKVWVFGLAGRFY